MFWDKMKPHTIYKNSIFNIQIKFVNTHILYIKIGWADYYLRKYKSDIFQKSTSLGKTNFTYNFCNFFGIFLYFLKHLA